MCLIKWCQRSFKLLPKHIEATQLLKLRNVCQCLDDLKPWQILKVAYVPRGKHITPHDSMSQIFQKRPDFFLFSCGVCVCMCFITKVIPLFGF